MRRTGPPANQRSRLSSERAFVLAAILIMALAAGPSFADPPAQREGELQRAIELIVKSFRTGKSDLIASLVPADCKAFISLAAVGDGGYYSRDQVYFMFNKVFSQSDTVDFRLRRQRTENRDGDSDKRPDPPAFVFYVATWKYHSHDGVDAENQIHFLLSLKKGSWALVEIREAQ